MIKPAQIAVIASGLVLTLALFFWGDLKGPAKPMPSPAEQQNANTPHQSTFNLESYKQQQLAKLAAAQKDLFADLETKALNEKDATKKKALLNQLIIASEQNQLDVLACVYSKQISELDNSIDSWTKTGDNFTQTYSLDTSQSELKHYLLHEAIASYTAAQRLDTANVKTKIRLASAYMDGGEQVMEGVQILLGIVRDNPNNIDANFILGRYGIISGQYDKAVQRLTKVVELDPRNFEAHLLLGEAYFSLGQKEKAIEYYQKSKALINNPQFSAEIDAYIEKIKNS
ncbi:MAG: tetratricopeptide repeat protein [Chitinophagales bacterium]|nr:tetratricopeptide repeat protein [Chitinophagales bacterium]